MAHLRRSRGWTTRRETTPSRLGGAAPAAARGRLRICAVAHPHPFPEALSTAPGVPPFRVYPQVGLWRTRGPRRCEARPWCRRRGDEDRLQRLLAEDVDERNRYPCCDGWPHSTRRTPPCFSRPLARSAPSPARRRWPSSSPAPSSSRRSATRWCRCLCSSAGETPGVNADYGSKPSLPPLRSPPSAEPPPLAHDRSRVVEGVRGGPCSVRGPSADG